MKVTEPDGDVWRVRVRMLPALPPLPRYRDRSKRIGSKLWPRRLSGYSLDALGHEEKALLDAAVQRFLDKAAAAETTSHEGLGLGMDVILTASDLVGNALTWEDRIVHLALFTRSEDSPTGSADRAERIESPSRRLRGRTQPLPTDPGHGEPQWGE